MAINPIEAGKTPGQDPKPDSIFESNLRFNLRWERLDSLPSGLEQTRNCFQSWFATPNWSSEVVFAERNRFQSQYLGYAFVFSNPEIRGTDYDYDIGVRNFLEAGRRFRSLLAIPEEDLARPMKSACPIGYSPPYLIEPKKLGPFHTLGKYAVLNSYPKRLTTEEEVDLAVEVAKKLTSPYMIRYVRVGPPEGDFRVKDDGDPRLYAIFELYLQDMRQITRRAIGQLESQIFYREEIEALEREKEFIEKRLEELRRQQAASMEKYHPHNASNLTSLRDSLNRIAAIPDSLRDES